MSGPDRTVEKLLRQQAALAAFGSFAFRERSLPAILAEAARVCAAGLEVSHAKVCRYRPAENDLLIEAGCGWHLGVVGRVVSQANESSPQGRAYTTGEPVIIRNLHTANNLQLPPFYADHGIVSTVDVVIPAIEGAPYGILEVDSTYLHQYDEHDINFLTGFANVLAEAVATVARLQAMQDLLDARNLLAEELQHRVRNNLQMVGGMLESVARGTADVGARTGIEEVMRRVTTLAQVYDSLLGVGLAEQVDLAGYLQALCARLPGLQPARSHPVRILCHAAPVTLGLDGVTALGMVVAELVANSYGHAFPDRAGAITVTLARTGMGHAAVTVADDGVGFDPDAPTSRHGTALVRKLAGRMGATLTVQSGEGTVWTLAFAVPDGVSAAA